MDDAEQTACEYLRSCGFGDPVYEPDGNVPPDFLLDAKVAVEVRRLNKMIEIESEARGLEEISIPLARKVPTLLKQLGPSTVAETSWFVYLTFKRPVQSWRKLRDCLRKELRLFRQHPASGTSRIYIEKNLTVHLDRASTAHDQFFVWGGYGDLDAGGWLIPDLEQNMKICIREKVAKVSAYRERYSEWWLVLIDQIAYVRIEDKDAVHLCDRLHKDLAAWDRVLLVNPLDARRGLQIWPVPQMCA